MNWVQGMLDDEGTFPSQIGTAAFRRRPVPSAAK